MVRLSPGMPASQKGGRSHGLHRVGDELCPDLVELPAVDADAGGFVVHPERHVKGGVDLVPGE